METKQERKWELRIVSLFLAVIVALMGFSAAVATKEEPQAEPVAQEAAPSYQDPSLAGLSVDSQAEADLDPGKMYY
jgi:hypothetical protein